MKKRMFLLALLLTVGVSFGQGGKTVSLMEEIKGKWELNEHGLPFYTKIIDNLNSNKKELLEKTYVGLMFNSSQYYDILEKSEDKILFLSSKEIHFSGYGKSTEYISPLYFSSIEFKDNKCKVELVLKNWVIEGGVGSVKKINPKDYFPLNKEVVFRRNMLGKAFYKQHNKIDYFFDDIENIVTKQGASSTDTATW